MSQEFRGQCMGVRIEPRTPNDGHMQVMLLVEDDEQWIEKARISSYWIDELISQLQLAKRWMEDNGMPDMSDGRQYGFKFKKGA